MNLRREFITCCPACNTSFRVTREQMEMASGAVRCGACLRIFQADEQMIEDRKVAEVEDSHSEPLDFGTDEIQSRYWQDFDLYIEEVFTTHRSPEEATHAAEYQSYYDESCEADLFEDVLSEADVFEDELSEAYLFEDEISEAFEDELSKDDLSRDHDVSLDSEQEEVEVTELVAQLDLEDDPEILVGEQVPRLETHPAWFAALPVLVISGFLQFAWFNHEVYAQQAEYRPWYLIVCRWIGCELPEYSNPADLSTSNLIVRSHPDVEDALIIDAIVRNSAIYRQRFPFLQLQFQDIHGNPVAQRRFNPENYLAGELRGLRFIPGNTEVRFSLEIVDPGKNALGYYLEVMAIHASP
ncbi:MAG: zinc-ribbon and DUF3426 domain-containing protein [Gammaproteobacteria bacterium]|nr:zinc-ribbon and DUF3426 domain-containing protein [Gammaproteobacteria bacterium]